MTVKPLKLDLFSGGLIRIDRAACMTCKTKACIKNCVSSTMEPVLKIEGEVPVLSRTDMPTQKGWCVECMACELDCNLYGKKAISIEFPEDQ